MKELEHGREILSNDYITRERLAHKDSTDKTNAKLGQFHWRHEERT
jgi:hypothetical protein